MNPHFALKALTWTIVIYFYLCTIKGRANSNQHLENSMSQTLKLYRRKETSDYFYFKAESLQRESAHPVGSRSDFLSPKNFRSNNPNKKPNHMMKVTDLSQLKDIKSRRSIGKKDPIAEEKILPDALDHVAAPKSRKPGFKIGDNLVGVDSVGDKISMPYCGQTDDLEERIVNGKDALEGAHSWIVAIFKNGDAWCGGSILNERWVISAAHCFMGDQIGSFYAIRVGTLNRNEGTTYRIEKVISHERFNLDNMLNSDIALLKISEPIKFGKLVKSICLSSNAYEEPKNNTLVVAGWGQITFENPNLPVMLKDVKLNIISDGECSRKYRRKNYTIYKSQICTWNYKKDACQGDSGGPAVEVVNGRAILIGLVSYGSTCADDYPGVYTQVSYFINWIATTMRKNE